MGLYPFFFEYSRFLPEILYSKTGFEGVHINMLFLPDMRIAIDCRIWNLPGAEELFFSIALVRTLLQKSSDHRFFLIFDQSPPTGCKASNTQSLILKPKANSAAARFFWYDLRLPGLLSAHQIDLFIGASGYISLRTPVKQILLLNDVLSGEQAPSATGWTGNWYPRRLPAMLEKADVRVATTPAQVQSTVPSKSKLSFSFITFSPFTHKSFSEAEKQTMKEELTNGAEFFLCREGWQTLEEALELLLAFSAFKKRMQTGMKLVLIGDAPKEKAWSEKLQTFRYREDVIVPARNEHHEPPKMIAAAWALIHLPSRPHFRILQSALCLGTPVITRPSDAIREMAGESVCYCTDLPGESLSQNMMRIYKDEKLRSDHIRLGKELARKWDLENAANSLLNLAF